MIGYKFKESYKEKVKKSIVSRQKQKEKRKHEREQEQEFFNEDGFYFISCYTSNRVPYGITLDEIEEDTKDKSILNYKINFDYDNLPF